MIARVLGKLYCGSEQELVKTLLSNLRLGKGARVLTMNLAILRQVVREKKCGLYFRAANFCVADGWPVVLAAKWLRYGVKERIAGSNLIYSLTEAAMKEGFSIFLIGGNPGTAEAAAGVLSMLSAKAHSSSTTRVANSASHASLSDYRGSVAFDPLSESDNAIKVARLKEKLRESKPDIVYIALGFQKSENLVDELQKFLPSTVFIGVGISFSYISGQIMKAPKFAERLGLEWVFRLLQEPFRLAPRYLLHDFPFAMLLFGVCLLRRLRGFNS